MGDEMKRPLGDGELLKLFTFPLPLRRRTRLGGRREKKSNPKPLKEVSCVYVLGNNQDMSSTVLGRASVSASLFFMSNLASSVTPLEECEEWKRVTDFQK